MSGSAMPAKGKRKELKAILLRPGIIISIKPVYESEGQPSKDRSKKIINVCYDLTIKQIWDYRAIEYEKVYAHLSNKAVDTIADFQERLTKVSSKPLWVTAVQNVQPGAQLLVMLPPGHKTSNCSMAKDKALESKWFWRIADDCSHFRALTTHYF